MKGGSSEVIRGHPRYDVFLHEAGQFWPRSEMFSFGQSSVITVAPQEELVLQFSVKEIQKMKTRDRDCIEDDSYRATDCFKKYLGRPSTFN